MYRHVQICTFSIKLELPENRTIEFPINWHSGSSSLRRPTFQRTAPGGFSNPVKYRTQVNILATFSIKLELLEKQLELWSTFPAIRVLLKMYRFVHVCTSKSYSQICSRTSQIMYRSSNRNSSLLLQNIDLYIFNKTLIAGKRLRRMSYKLARSFIITASTYIPKCSSRKNS